MRWRWLGRSTHTVLPEAEDQLHRAIVSSHVRRTLLTLSGHSAVHSVAWSPDGKRLATGSGWHREGVGRGHGKELLSVVRRRRYRFQLAWSPDGKRLATDGRAAKVWDAAKGKELLNLSRSAVAIGTVAWSPDGKQAGHGQPGWCRDGVGHGDGQDAVELVRPPSFR